MHKLIAGALLAAATMGASGAQASYEVKGLAHNYMTYTTADQVASRVTSGYNGVGTVYIQTASSAAQGGGFICTGSLLNASTVLTAAHCVYPFSGGGADPVVSLSFYLPSLGDATEGYRGISYAFNPKYDTADHSGDILSGYDVALFTLSRAAKGHDTYDLFTGDPFQQYTEVGTGTIGGPDGTNGNISDYRKRTGNNLYELYGSDLFSDSSEGVVLYDFDDGTAAHDVFGRNLGRFDQSLIQRGVTGESAASPGDSGGPEFIDGKIVSVTSFGISGGIFQATGVKGDPFRSGYCGADSTDPYNVNRSTAKTPIQFCTNSSVGEIGGNTLTAFNADFINGYLNGSVLQVSTAPEPATWVQMIAGFGLLGGAMRTRRRPAPRLAKA